MDFRKGEEGQWKKVAIDGQKARSGRWLSVSWVQLDLKDNFSRLAPGAVIR
jgi:hypothetical protein